MIHKYNSLPKTWCLAGGRRGAGKSVTCCNLASTVYDSGRSAIYFTIEMDSRQILQRICSISTGVPLKRLRSKNLSSEEWNLNWRLVGRSFSRKRPSPP